MEMRRTLTQVCKKDPNAQPFRFQIGFCFLRQFSEDSKSTKYKIKSPQGRKTRNYLKITKSHSEVGNDGVKHKAI